MGKFFGDDLDNLPADIYRLVDKAKNLTPAQLKTLDAFLATLNNPGETHHLKVTESKSDYRANLYALFPKNEIGLGEALVKISEIAYLNELTEQDIMYLHKKAVGHYGVPVPPGGKANIAALGPKSPGQIKLRNNGKDKTPKRKE